MTERIYIPMSRACICLDCSGIGNDPRECPACASRALATLASFMDRPTVAQRIEPILAAYIPGVA